MATLTGQTIADSYEQLLSLPDGGGNGTTHVAVTDGDGGTTFPITLATDAIMITSTNRLEFGDDASYIHQSADGVLDLVSDTEIELNATTIDINGAVDISGNSQFSGTVTVGVDDTGLDVKFFGATAGSYMLWDESDDQLELVGSNVNMGNGYILKEQGKQNHIGSTFSSPYFFMNSATTDNIATASTSILPSGGEDRSVSAWIYPSSTLTNTYNTIVKWGTQSGTYPQYGIVINKDDSNKIRLLGYGNDVTQTGSEIVQLGKWNHVVLTYSGTTNNLYVNGVHDSSFAFPNGALQTASSSALYIGSFDGTNYNFNGSIGGVQIWNKVLDASEVKELYSGKSVSYEYKGANNTDLVTGDDSTFASNTGFWTLSGGTGTVSITSGVLRFDEKQSGWGAKRQNLVTAGKAYRATFTISNYSAGSIKVYGNGVYSSTAVSSNGTHSLEFVAGNANTDFWINSIGETTLDLDNFTLVPIGAIAEYDGTGVASDKWFDKSGNDLHATVSGAEVVNAPSGDDGLVYEEGTWSPVICQADDLSDALAMHNETTGSYVRIGNVVHVSGQVIGNSSTGDMSASDSIAIKGLPYPIPNSNYNRGVATLVSLTGNLASGKRVSGYVIQNSSQINLYTNDGTAEGELRFDEFTNAGHALFQATYII